MSQEELDERTEQVIDLEVPQEGIGRGLESMREPLWSTALHHQYIDTSWDQEKEPIPELDESIIFPGSDNDRNSPFFQPANRSDLCRMNVNELRACNFHINI